jgi:acetyl-CoA carboxylase carboxyl transferase subunit alpha
MSSEEIYNNRKNKFLKIGRNKGCISNLEDLRSLKSENKNLNQILKSKKVQVIGVSVVLASMILLFYLL